MHSLTTLNTAAPAPCDELILYEPGHRLEADLYTDEGVPPSGQLDADGEVEHLRENMPGRGKPRQRIVFAFECVGQQRYGGQH